MLAADRETQGSRASTPRSFSPYVQANQFPECFVPPRGGQSLILFKIHAGQLHSQESRSVPEVLEGLPIALMSLPKAENLRYRRPSKVLAQHRYNSRVCCGAFRLPPGRLGANFLLNHGSYHLNARRDLPRNKIARKNFLLLSLRPQFQPYHSDTGWPHRVPLPARHRVCPASKHRGEFRLRFPQALPYAPHDRANRECFSC